MNDVYNLVDYFLMNKNEKEIHSYIDNVNKKTIFDVGSFQGKFTKKIIELEKKNIATGRLNTNLKNRYFLFDPNPNGRKYVRYLTKSKNNVSFYNYGLDNEKKVKNFHINKYFEASGSSFQTLIKNDKIWNVSRRFVLTIVNYFSQMRKIFTKIKYKRLDNFQSLKVQTMTIDFFCLKKKISNIDLLKIDTEGHEEYVLKGAKNMLRKNKIKVIYVEVLSTKNNFKNKKKKIINFLSKNNFTFIKEYPIKSLSILSNLSASDLLLVNKNIHDGKF